MSKQFILICPATRGISLALTRHYLQHTDLPVYATHRSGSSEEHRKNMLTSAFGRPLKVDHERLKLLHVDLGSESSIEAGANMLQSIASQNNHTSINTAFFTGGMLHPERRPEDLDTKAIHETFQLNVISHLLVIKHFSKFLPSSRSSDGTENISKWVHVSARVGSTSDNKLGGWYSYRASKAALNQVIKTFDIHLQTKQIQAISVGVHPGTVRTMLSKPFWGGVKDERLFEPEFAAERLVNVVAGLDLGKRGRVWDWAGNEVTP